MRRGHTVVRTVASEAVCRHHMKTVNPKVVTRAQERKRRTSKDSSSAKDSAAVLAVTGAAETERIQAPRHPAAQKRPVEPDGYTWVFG